MIKTPKRNVLPGHLQPLSGKRRRRIPKDILLRGRMFWFSEFSPRSLVSAEVQIGRGSLLSTITRGEERNFYKASVGKIPKNFLLFRAPLATWVSMECWWRRVGRRWGRWSNFEITWKKCLVSTLQRNSPRQRFRFFSAVLASSPVQEILLRDDKAITPSLTFSTYQLGDL